MREKGGHREGEERLQQPAGEGDGLEEVLGDILGEGEEDLLGEEDLAALRGEGGEEGEGEEEVEALMREAYARGRRLGRLGESILMVSEDGLRAFFTGALPEGTRQEEVERLLEEAGICYGVRQSAIRRALPRRQRARQERGRARLEAERGEVVVAQGREPVPPREARVEYLVEAGDEGQVAKFKQALASTKMGEVRACPVSLPLVRPGQVLARATCVEGKPGCDVFGKEISPPALEAMAIPVGENVLLSEDGAQCRAACCGYAGLLGGALTVLSPLWISRDLLRAFFVFLPQGSECGAPAPGDIEALLADVGVVFGIDGEAIGALCRRLEKKQSVERLTLVARGREAVPGRGAVWEFSFAPELTRYYGEIARILSRSRNLDYLLDYSRGLSAKVVSADEKLAVRRPPQPGEPGMDLFGEQFLPEEAGDEALEVGACIYLSEDGQSCFSEIYGYVGIGRNRVEIVPPLWIPADSMEAHFVCLPPLGEKRVPTCEEVERLLALKGVRYGIDHRRIAVLCEKFAQGLPVDVAVCVARGEAPREGTDGDIRFALDVERRPGLLLEDGSMDFKQLNLTPLVAEGQLIGTRVPAERGSPGTDLTGTQIAARDGRELEIEAGKNLRCVRQQGEPECFVAEVEGELVLVDHRHQQPPMLHLAVHRVLKVDGDVGYATGHIEYPGSVHVTGSVLSGFAVKAEGNVVVGDSVYDGARIECDGNVAVRHGASGEKALIRAGGSVYARFLNAAQVRARVDVVLAEYAHNAQVEAGSRMEVLGQSNKKQSGAIVGGRVLAGHRVRARAIGSEAGRPAQVVAGVDAELFRQVAALNKNIDQYREALAKTLRSLQMEGAGGKRLRQMLLAIVLRARGERKKMLARAAKNILHLQARLSGAEQEQQALDEKLRALAGQASVEVAGAVAAGTLVRIGSQTLKVGLELAEITQLRFSLGERDGRELILTTAH